MAEGGETLRPPQDANQEVKPPPADSDQRRGISPAFRAAVGRIWRSWRRGPEEIVDTMSKASTRLNPFSRPLQTEEPPQKVEEPSKS